MSALTRLSSGISTQTRIKRPFVQDPESIIDGDDITAREPGEPSKTQIINPEEDALYYDLMAVTNAGIAFIGPEVKGYIDPNLELEFEELAFLPQDRRPTDEEIKRVLLTLHKNFTTEKNNLSRKSINVLNPLLETIIRHRTISSWLRDASMLLIKKGDISDDTFNKEIADYKRVFKNLKEALSKDSPDNEELIYLKKQWDYLNVSEKRFINLFSETDDLSLYNLHLIIMYLENADRRESFDKFVQNFKKDPKANMKYLKRFIEEILDTDWLDEGYRDYFENQEEDPLKPSRKEIFFDLLYKLNDTDKKEISEYIKIVTSDIPSPAGDFRKSIRQELIDFSSDKNVLVLSNLAQAG